MADDNRLMPADVSDVWDALGQLHVAVDAVRNRVTLIQHGGALNPHEEHFCTMVKTKMEEADAVVNQCSVFVRDYEIEEVDG